MTVDTEKTTEITPAFATLFKGKKDLPPIPQARLDKLGQIFEEVKKRHDFPNLACGTASHIILDRTGLESKVGRFELDLPFEENDDLENIRQGGNTVSHCWNLDSKRRIYDLTLFQFNAYIKGNPIPAGISIIEPGHSLYEKYLDALEWGS